MYDNILKTLNKNNQTSLQFATDIAQTIDNTTGEQLTRSISIDVNDPLNMNSRSSVIDNAVPYVQINNTISTTNSSSTIQSRINASETFESSVVKRSKISFGNTLVGNNLLVYLNKPSGFNNAVTETVNRKGAFKIYSFGGELIYTQTDIINNLYNSEITKTILSSDALTATGPYKLNIEAAKFNTSIPFVIDNKTIKTKPLYNLDNFIIKVDTMKKNNIFHRILHQSDKSLKFKNTNPEYVIDFSIFFDVEITDKFPIEFLWMDSASASSANNKLFTTKVNYSVTITNIPRTISFKDNCLNGKYESLYIVFI